MQSPTRSLTALTFASFLLTCITSPSRAEDVKAWNGPACNIQHGTLQIEGRAVVHEDGTPFWWRGDTVWFLLKWKEQDIERYLENRRSKGFTVIQMVGSYGFKKMARVTKLALEKGIYMGWLPTWGNRGREWSEKEYADYCKRLAGTLKEFPNVIFILGGDVQVNDKSRKVWRAGAGGLRAGGYKGIIAFHPIGPSSTVDWFDEKETWLSIAMLQSGHALKPNTKIVERTLKATKRPVIDGEPRYETIFVGLGKGPDRIKPHDVRNAAYWSVFSGSFGHTYGHNDCWQPGGKDWGGSGDFWKALDAEGAFDMLHLRRLMQSRSAKTWIPDQSLVPKSSADGDHPIVAIRAKNNQSALIYFPTGGATQVDLSKFKGPLKAKWFDPRTGNSTPTNDAPAQTTSTIQAPTTGENNDWVLIVESVPASDLKLDK
ncbi:MAG: glycoside hydrolase family 140 protein [Planctomycetota bacterium]